MEPEKFLRDVFKFSSKEFRSMWAAVNDFVLMEALDNGGKPQGLSLLAIQQVYQADEDGAFAVANYVGSSDDYYQYWTMNEMDPETYHHFCRGPSLRSCTSKLGKDLVIHVRRWAPLTLKEAEGCLREWGISPTLAKKSLTRNVRDVTGRKDDEGGGKPASKSAPPLPP